MSSATCPVYHLGQEIGQGTFSRVYATSDPTTGHHLAIKCPLDANSATLLAQEAETMKNLVTCSCVPHLVCLSQSPVGLVMERVGKTLLDLQSEAEPLSVKTTAMIAIKAISAIQELHSFGYLHRDIKPNNIAIAKHPSSSRLYLLDFGLSTAFLKNGVHVAYREQVPFQGTPYFCSLANLRGVRPSRRDDLEALGYVLVYLQKGYLPWFDTSLDLAAIREMRENYSIAKLCQGLEPEFAEFLLACQTIGFSDAPDYAYFHRKCTYLLQKLGHELDWKYDWTKPLVKTFSFRHTYKSHAQRRSSLPVTQADCKEQESNECSTPVASIHQLPAFKFPRPKSFAS